MGELSSQLQGSRLITAKIFYHMPDFEHLLQEYIWQDYDLAPRFPGLQKFLDFWTRELDGKLHSVYVAKKTIISPGEYRFVQWEETLPPIN